MEKITDMIKHEVVAFLEDFRLLYGENKLLVAFSGGPDSLCLLDVLYKLNNQFDFILIAAHLNHNWRGKESEKEAKQAENYCKQRNIEFYTETLSSELPQTEDEARNQRYNFFNKIALKTSANSILTGHTRTDQAETVLYRIIKGTGIRGLAGIPAVREQNSLPAIYRPLLKNIRREDCIRYCEENALTPSFDPSNFDEKYVRNRIRHSLFPELRTYNSIIDSALVRLSVIARDSEEIINEYTGKIQNQISKTPDIICAQSFLNLSTPMQKQIIVNFLSKNNIEYTFETIEDLMRFIQYNKYSKSGKTFSIAKDTWLFVSSGEIKIINQIRAKQSDIVIPVNLNGETFHPELNMTIKIEKWQGGRPKEFPRETSTTVYADLGKINEAIMLRTRRPGDVIQPFGMKEKTKLKKYLINRGIPKHIRDEIPLLAINNEVLYVTGIGISEKLRVHDIPTHIIKLQY